MSTFPPLTPSLQPDNAADRAEAAKRLKSAWKSMLISAGISVLLLIYLVVRIIATLHNPALRGSSTTLLVIGAVILARLAFNGYRLFNKWKALKAAQDHHRSFSQPT